MNESETEDIDGLLRRALGKSIEWHFYDRTLRTPLNFVLDRAADQLDGGFKVCWIDNAPADIFCLRGLSQPVIAYSPRFVEVWGDIRGLVTSSIWGEGLLERLAESDCLALMAEFSLEKNDPDLACSALIQSILRKEGIFRVPNTIDSLEHEPISFGYVATWFYGLCRELGHLRRDSDEAVLKDEWVADAVVNSLESSSLPASVRDEGIAAIRRGDAEFVLNTKNLQSEGLADAFGASVFLRTMHDLGAMSNGNQEPRDEVQFAASLIAELLLSLNIISVFERCRRVGHLASMGFPSRTLALEAVFHPTALEIRGKFLMTFLRHEVAAYLFGESPTDKHIEIVTNMGENAMESLRTNLERFEVGMNAAIAFVADRERRTNFIEQLDQLDKHLRQEKAPADLMTIEHFVARAHSLGRHASLLDALKARTRDDATMVMPKVEGTRGFSCAWVVGPDRFNRPFSLETRHGTLIFAFALGSQVYEPFADVSKGLLAEGFELKNTFILAETDVALRDALAKHLPIGREFIVAAEGTPQFDTYFRELSTGTIWEDRPGAGLGRRESATRSYSRSPGDSAAES